jgi:hypothetical protein
MKYLVFIFNFFLILFFSAADTIGASYTKNFASFLAGILLIEENKSLSSEQKALEYKQLQQITGISGSEAIQFINSFRDNPAEFKVIYTSIKAELTGTKKEKETVSENKKIEKKTK